MAVLCIAVGAGAAGAINMWYDRDIDALMQRTRNRPLPAGRMAPGDALGFGCVLAVGSVIADGAGAQLVAAALLALDHRFYVFVYTIWLKRRTPQNIVIGGAAGAFPPLVGWAAVTGDVGLPALALFALIFFWTPPHFWALSLYRTGDYARAGVPMLPVVAGRARDQAADAALYAGAVAAGAGADAARRDRLGLWRRRARCCRALFTARAVRVMRDPGERSARQMFGFSILYLFLLFALHGRWTARRRIAGVVAMVMRRARHGRSRAHAGAPRIGRCWPRSWRSSRCSSPSRWCGMGAVGNERRRECA